jgi:A/G-specific adenine glycosylase
VQREDQALGRSEALLSWFDQRRRDLPWRRTRDPWAVLVSESMLQQTQVSRVVPRYEAFLARWPTAVACAGAEVGEVVAAWSGLGYNRRAVNLHRCATEVAERHDGVVPGDLDALVRLPGVGPYTARAVLAFAYETDGVGVLDTNAARVLARWHGRSLRPGEAQEAADAAVPPGSVWSWNQAMLDLGATLCSARTPGCDQCPVVRWCRWGAAGAAEADPARGSAGVSVPQSRFAGSDRQGRGRLVAAMTEGPVGAGRLATIMGWPADPERALRVAATVVADGLAEVDRSGAYRLPGRAKGANGRLTP